VPRIVIADDHTMVREALRDAFRRAGYEVVGEAANGQEAVAMARALTPRVIVMDMAMPGLNGVQATREILNHNPEVAVLILSMYSGESYVSNALAAGARGYLLKNALEVDLARAVKALGKGQQVIGRGVLAIARTPDPKYDRLTPLEKQILELAAQGKSNKAIATLLAVSENTVAVHRANIMAELDIHRTTDLILWAVKRGLVHLP